MSYGSALPNGQSYRQQMLEELGSSLDLGRVHFLGKVPYATYLKILQVSRVHVYLTYPFVLSWSMLEAISAGCLVVGSRTAPVEEVMRHEHNGLLVDFFDHAALADQVVLALEDRHAHDGLRNQARQDVVGQYDLARVCLPAYLALLHKLLGRAP